MKRICLYHAGCPDGFGAAWAIWRAWEGEGVFVARGHEDRLQPQRAEAALVVFADIAPQLDEAREIAEQAAQLVVLDHHVTARDRFESEPALCNLLEREGHELIFDLGVSGAVLTWRYLNPEHEPPDLLRYVQDQDLWNWALPESREVNAAIASYRRSFDIWNELAERPIEELAREGRPIVRADRVEVERILHQACPLRIGELRVESVNASANRSAIGHELAERKLFGEPFGCVYRIEGTRVHATLYSIGDCDVSRIAAGYGGGGHPNAAGFTVVLADWLRDFVA